MGRRKIKIAMVEDPIVRHKTFSKRRFGLFNKANELAILCGATIAIVMFSPGNRPCSFGHPSIEAIASKFLQQELESKDTSSSKFPNMENLSLELDAVLAEIKEAECKGKVHDEVIKGYKVSELTQLKGLKDSFTEFKDIMKSRICDIDISESMMLLAKEPVVETKNPDEKKNENK